LNTNYVYPSSQVGEFRNAMLYAIGPASYASTGDPVYNPGSGEYINFPSTCMSLSGNYRVRFIPLAVGTNQVRAGGGVGGPSVSGWTARYEFANTSGGAGVASVTGSGGSGMTVGTYALTIAAPPAGGVQATGTLTVLTATTFSTKITNPGAGYLTAPATSAATGGTPPTLTAVLSVAGAEVGSGANLSGETFQFGALVSSL
jgi:hypothetical protein